MKDLLEIVFLCLGIYAAALYIYSWHSPYKRMKIGRLIRRPGAKKQT